MANYADSTRTRRTLTEREQRTLLKGTGEHRAGYRNHCLYALRHGPARARARRRRPAKLAWPLYPQAALLPPVWGGSVLASEPGSILASVAGLPVCITLRTAHSEFLESTLDGSKASEGARCEHRRCRSALKPRPATADSTFSESVPLKPGKSQNKSVAAVS